MRFRRAAGQADNHAARVHIPVRRAKADEGGNHVDAARVGHALRHPLGIRRGVDDAQAVAQPLHSGARHENRAFESILDFSVRAPRDGRHKAVFRLVDFRAGVHQHEAARAVCIFRHARLEAVLPEKRRLLVSRRARDGHRTADDLRVGLSVNLAGRANLRQHRRGNRQIAKQLLVPFQFINIIHQRTGRVRIIRHVDPAARQLPDQPAVDGAEEKIPLLRRRPRAIHIVQNPFDFRAGEIRVDDQPGLVVKLVGKPLTLQILADVRRLPRLPDNRVIDGPPGVLVPNHRRLALVRNADGGKTACSQIRLFERLPHDRDHRAPDFLGVVLNPARFGEMLRELLLRDADDPRLLVEDDRPVAGGSGIQRHHVLCH